MLSGALRIAKAESDIRRAARKRSDGVDVDVDTELCRVYSGSFDLVVGSGSSVYDDDRIRDEGLDVLDLARITFGKLAGRSNDISSGKVRRQTCHLW